MRLVTVDETDTVIGAKDRAEMQPGDICRVARLIIRNSKGQILLAQRALAKEKDPGVWGLAVEGSVAEGEDYESNIRKEAEEEIGVQLEALELGPKLRMTGKYNHYSQCFIYHADLEVSELHLQEEEVALVRWYDPAELKRLVATHPERFGYNFSRILEAIRPLLEN